MLIDFDGIEAKGPADLGGSSIIPPGVYHVAVNTWKPQQSKSGKDMLVIEFMVAQGSYKGKKITHYFVVGSDTGKAVFLRFLKTVATNDAPIKSFDTQHMPRLIGKTLVIRTLSQKSGGFVNVTIRNFYKTSELEQAESDYNSDDSDLTEPPVQKFSDDVAF